MRRCRMFAGLILTSLMWLGCQAGTSEKVNDRAFVEHCASTWNVEGAAPRTVAQAEAAKSAGKSWTNEDVRDVYLCRITEIAEADKALQGASKTLLERAKAAYEHRHHARVTARAMMASEFEVKALQGRDQKKYGNPDGPTFEYLVEKGRKKGKSDDDVYASIIESSQRSDRKTNKQVK